MPPIQGPNKSETQRFQKRAFDDLQIGFHPPNCFGKSNLPLVNMYNKNWHFDRGPLSTHLKFGVTSLKRGWPVSGNPY